MTRQRQRASLIRDADEFWCASRPVLPADRAARGHGSGSLGVQCRWSEPAFKSDGLRRFGGAGSGASAGPVPTPVQPLAEPLGLQAFRVGTPGDDVRGREVRVGLPIRIIDRGGERRQRFVKPWGRQLCPGHRIRDGLGAIEVPYTRHPPSIVCRSGGEPKCREEIGGLRASISARDTAFRRKNVLSGRQPGGFEGLLFIPSAHPSARFCRPGR